MSTPALPDRDALTFTALLLALDRGKVDALERVLAQVARTHRVHRDDAWTAMADLWRYVDEHEAWPVAVWLRRIRAWLARPETRASLMSARGLRRADVLSARGAGHSAAEARQERLAEAWSAWQTHPDTQRDDLARTATLLHAVAGGHHTPATRAVELHAAGLDHDAIAAHLDVRTPDVQDLVQAGTEALLARLSDSGAFTLRRVLGADNADLERESGLDPAAVRMRVSRGRRELAHLVGDLAA